MGLLVDLASRSLKGARAYQEDTCAFAADSEGAARGADLGARIEPAPSRTPKGEDLVAVLADGMGGHAGGARASQIACRHFLEAFTAARGAPDERLTLALMAANQAMANTVATEPDLSGMGSTLIGVTVSEAGLRWISVGDSPLYLWRKGEMALVNEDHSLAPLLDVLVAEGSMSIEEARRHPNRHFLRSAVTGEDIDLIDLAETSLPLETGDVVVLASDGVQTLAVETIAKAIETAEANGADAIAEALIAAVEAACASHQDNTTVMVLKVLRAGSAASTGEALYEASKTAIVEPRTRTAGRGA